jgi:hypothetical protein
MRELAEVIRGWQQGGGGITAQHRVAPSGPIVEDLPVRLFERGHHRHARFHKPGALGAMGHKTALAPQDPGPKGPFSRIIRQLHTLVAHERPQGRPQLEDLPVDGLSVGHPACLASFQQPFHFAPNWPYAVIACTLGPKAEYPYGHSRRDLRPGRFAAAHADQPLQLLLGHDRPPWVKTYTTALRTPYRRWVQPPRRQAPEPTPKPRWLPLPELLYAQVVKLSGADVPASVSRGLPEVLCLRNQKAVRLSRKTMHNII